MPKEKVCVEVREYENAGEPWSLNKYRPEVTICGFPFILHPAFNPSKLGCVTKEKAQEIAKSVATALGVELKE